MAENSEKITPTEENIAAENSADQVNSVLEQGETAADNAAAAEPVSEVDQLRAQLAEQQAKFLYLQAEYQNFRRRAARDISDARSHAIADTLTPFLSVSDFLGMAQTAAEKTDNLDAIKQGLTMIIAQFDKALEEMSVRKFTSTGEKFNPDLHDAVGREPSDTVPEDVVIREWNCGYKIGEKLLRPARVLVSSGPAAAATAENADKE